MKSFASLDMLTTVVRLCMIALNFLPLLVPLVVFLNIEPFYYVFVLILPDHVLSYKLILLLRTVLSLSCVFLAVRHINITLVVVFVFLRRVKLCLDSLAPIPFKAYSRNKTPSCDWIKCIQSVLGYRIFYAFFIFYVQDLLSNIACVTITAGLATGIIANFGSLMMYHLTPFPVYIASVNLSLAIPVLSLLLFPFITGVLESSNKVHRQWMKQARVFPRIRRRLFLREIRSIVPCSVKLTFGNYNFMIFDNAVTVAYFRKYVEYTINACLSISL
jgi:hypothetical protein